MRVGVGLGLSGTGHLKSLSCHLFIISQQYYTVHLCFHYLSLSLMM